MLLKMHPCLCQAFDAPPCLCVRGGMPNTHRTPTAGASCPWLVSQMASHHPGVPPAARLVWEPLAGQHPLGNTSQRKVGVPRELRNPVQIPVLRRMTKSTQRSEVCVQLSAQTLLITFNLHWRVAKSRNEGCLLISLFFKAAFQERLNHPGNASFSQGCRGMSLLH